MLLWFYSAACLLQRAWRGGRGRYIALLQKKLAKLRSKEGQAATTIQRAFRGDKARKRVGSLNMLMAGRSTSKGVEVQAWNYGDSWLMVGVFCVRLVWQVLAMRAGLAKDNRDHGAARLIQKIFRGHKVRRLHIMCI